MRLPLLDYTDPFNASAILLLVALLLWVGIKEKKNILPSIVMITAMLILALQTVELMVNINNLELMVLLVKNIIIGLTITASLLWCGSATAPVLTSIAQSVGIDLGTSAIFISSFAATAMIQSYLVFLAFTANPVIGIPALIVVSAVYWYFIEYRGMKNKQQA